MKVVLLILVAVAVSGVSCERHEFEGSKGTRQLHEHAAGHGDPADHAEKPEH